VSIDWVMTPAYCVSALGAAPPNIDTAARAPAANNNFMVVSYALRDIE